MDTLPLNVAHRIFFVYAINMGVDYSEELMVGQPFTSRACEFVIR
jgi:hypothetical protein